MSRTKETRPTTDSSNPPGELSAGKKRLFTVVMWLLPLLFFGLLEGGLRLGGYGADYPLFVDAPGAPGRIMPSRDVANRYFARNASVPTPNPDYFLRDKPDGTIRIVAQGGSSTAGFPYYRGAAFPQVLGERIRQAYPDREVEVVNTAMAAVNSYTLLDLADEIIEVKPDVVVIYAGHNEFYGALGAASTESLGRSPGLVRTYLGLRAFRTVQLVRQLAGQIAGAFAPSRPTGRPPSGTLMARMIGEQSVPMDGEIYEAGRQQFASNLDRLLATYRDAGIPVYISTLGSNERDQRPFITEVSAGADSTALYTAIEEGQAQLRAGDSTAAVVSLERAVALDASAADAQYALGQAYLAVGQMDGARAAFIRARDLDALRFRAPTEFNAIIRETAERHGATVVEGEAAFREASDDGIVGFEVMLEHLHPNLEGYSVLADAFYDEIIEDALFGASPRPTPPGRVVRRVTPMDSLAGRLRVAQLTESWPYRPGEEQPVELDSARTPPAVVRLTERVMGGENWLAAADELVQAYTQMGRTDEARATLEAIAQAYPFLPEAWSDLAALELTEANLAGAPSTRASALYEQALRRDANHFPALSMLGAIRLQAGDRSTAIGLLERARAVSPASPQVLYNLAGAYMLEGRRADAIPLAQQLVQMEPGNATYQVFLGQLQQSAGQ
ncbi:MAG: tetratricopeptide repeat protein [Bacteroidota bacterium]